MYVLLEFKTTSRSYSKVQVLSPLNVPFLIARLGNDGVYYIRAGAIILPGWYIPSACTHSLS